MDGFLILSEYGQVLVQVNPEAEHALADNLLLLAMATPENSQGIAMHTPLRAFAAKVLDIMEAKGTAGLSMSPTVIEMMKKEKATQELKKIERFARENATN